MYWKKEAKSLASELKTDLKVGLSQEEARDRLEKEGPNVIPAGKGMSIWQLLLRQFASLIVWLLLVAVVFSLFLGEWIAAGAILVIVVLNAVLGFFQEYHAEESLAALKNLANPMSKVIRGGILITIPTKEIVVGDIIQLEAGDRVPADGRLFFAVQLTTQEAALTGESLSVHKEIEVIDESSPSLGQQKNMVFMGTVAVSGKGRLIVTQTGMKTQLGRIASLLQTSKEEKTPLQKRLEGLGHVLVWSCVGVILLTVILGVVRGFPWVDILLTGVSLAVAAVPEGLPAVVTIALAVGVQKMAKRHALIRKLSSVETLGCAEVICSDKTGTLTQNEMMVKTFWIDGCYYDVTGYGYAPHGHFEQNHEPIDLKEHPRLIEALKISTLCNNASLNHRDNQVDIVGDPTEGALLVAAFKAGLKKEELEVTHCVVGEMPFDPTRKMMSVVVETDTGKKIYLKGAPSNVLDRCRDVQKGSEVVVLSDGEREKILKAASELAQEGLRVLAFAMAGTAQTEPLEADLTFVGLVALYDPPRAEVREAIEQCRASGIRPVMVTGDHKDTARSVAKELGMMDSQWGVLEGKELDTLSEDQWKEAVVKTAVFCRTTPEQKHKIVRVWKSLGKVVAVTGDGINDAPAIKEADIGIAMGITGTDVTKEASDMVITDDNFASIVHAVEEGRGIYDNIIKFVNYLLSSNIAEILIIFIALAFGMKDPLGNSFIPLTAVQLLWLNLVTDGLPAVALGLDPIDPTVMQRPPRKKNEPILPLKFGLHLFAVSVVMTLGIFLACLYGLKISASYAQTMTLTAFVIFKMVRVQMVRGQYRIGFFSNPWIIFAIISSLALQGVIIYVPFLQLIFGTASIALMDWGLLLVLAFFVWALSVGVNRIFSFFSVKA
jgi:Ca2+-transporting ATPase